MTSKKIFNQISFIYSLTVFALLVFFFVFNKEITYKKLNFLFFYMISILLLIITYYLFLQRQVRKMKFPDIISAASICMLGGLALGILILLSLSISIIQPLMLLVFTPIYIAIPVGIANWLWLKKTDN